LLSETEAIGGKSAAVARVQIGFESRESFLRRMAVVLADPLRLKIVTELFLREMSPTLFFDEFGGGSVTRVARHFEVLVKHGWLRFIRSETGGKRRGGVEGFYRARELAVFDNETWAALPYSVRVEFSSTIFDQFAERVTEAMRAGTFDARDDRHFTWSAVLLDETGWARVTAAVDALFESLSEEQEDAKLRVHKSGEKPFLATVSLAAFESPRPKAIGENEQIAVSLPERTVCLHPFSRRISRVISDPVCLRIVTELNLQAMSPTGFHKKFGGSSKTGIYRRFALLTELGWLTKVDEKTGGARRGAKESFFRATGPVVFDNSNWADLSDSLKTTFSWTIFEQFSNEFKRAMDAGTLDARVERHLSWSLLLLDEFGWENVIAALDALFAFVGEEQAAARERMVGSREEKIRVTVGLGGFESPKDAAKAF
jgi:hypothetical protein